MTPLPAAPRLSAAWLGVVAALSALVLAADVAASFPGPFGHACRVALSLTCHQDASRSLRRDGKALGACARCTGLHAGGLAACAAALAAGGLRLGRARRGLGALAVAAVALLVADGVLGTVVATWDHPWWRATTGLLAAGLTAAWGLAACAAETRSRVGRPAGTESLA